MADPQQPAPDEGHVFLFSFALIADPHIVEPSERDTRLLAAVDWINDAAEARSIELTLVLGDIGWGEGLANAEAHLAGLAMSYVPIMGDNEVHAGEEEAFGEVFTPQYAALEAQMDGFRRGEIGTYNPEWSQTSWFQNLSFDYRGLRFVMLDWISRDDDVFYGEMATLHDFEGGTLPWFAEELGDVSTDRSENVLLFSHHPMLMGPGGFDVADLEEITALTAPVGEQVAAAWAGHLHVDHDETIYAGGYDVHVTDATWDDDNTIRVVEVWGNGTAFSFVQEHVIVPF